MSWRRSMSISQSGSLPSKNSSRPLSPPVGGIPEVPLREFNLSFLPARLFVCLSQQEYERVVTEIHGVSSDEKWLDPSQDGATQICDSAKAETRLIVICVDPEVCKDLSRLVEVCAHEAMHVVQMIERVMSEKEPGIEYPAYLLGKVTQYVYNQCTGVTK